MSPGDWQRSMIDPDGRYPVRGMTELERQAMRVGLLLPGFSMERTREVFQFTGIDPDDPVVIVTPESLEIRLPTVEWPHPNIPAPSSRFWKRFSWKRLKEESILRRVREARQIRLDEYRKCRFCKVNCPPEFLTHGACDNCAVEHLGIIH